MDPRFLPHNSHLDNPSGFAEHDPQLRRLSRQTYRYRSVLLAELTAASPGIYTLGGGRQIGKSTLLKQWMNELLAQGVAPQSISFFTGELIDDHHSLLGLIQAQLGASHTDSVNYLIIDEVTYIQQWDKAVKYAADAGMLEHTVPGADRFGPGFNQGCAHALSRTARQGGGGGFPYVSAFVQGMFKPEKPGHQCR